MEHCIHIYWGNGKGKTTAAVGLAVRMAGQGGRILFLQFLKGGETGEISLLSRLPQFDILRSEKAFPFTFQMTSDQKRELLEIHNGLLRQALEKCSQGQYSMAVFDEVFPALEEHLLDEDLLQKFLNFGKNQMEIVLTGHRPGQSYLEAADYVTEMRQQKHPYSRGLEARKGIEF